MPLNRRGRRAVERARRVVPAVIVVLGGAAAVLEEFGLHELSVVVRIFALVLRLLVSQRLWRAVQTIGTCTVKVGFRAWALVRGVVRSIRAMLQRTVTRLHDAGRRGIRRVLRRRS
ncbi:hypothetical protein ACQP0C_41825 (plasmid) [Nocardia sp. CA-129566]|uniref:hypothetical protein n=1 Tax=Nocardia sp. CA-129566 TaxID=3239976 RepID=UPI003D95800D